MCVWFVFTTSTLCLQIATTTVVVVEEEEEVKKFDRFGTTLAKCTVFKYTNGNMQFGTQLMTFLEERAPTGSTWTPQGRFWKKKNLIYRSLTDDTDLTWIFWPYQTSATLSFSATSANANKTDHKSPTKGCHDQLGDTVWQVRRATLPFSPPDNVD